MKGFRLLSALLFCLSLSYAIDIDLYYGEGCPHCATARQLLETMKMEYNLSMTAHEVYYDAVERQAYFNEYSRFGADVNKGGVPTIIVGKDTMIIGGLDAAQWRALFEACEEGRCPRGVYSHSTLQIPDGIPEEQIPTEIPEELPFADPLEEMNGAGALTLSVLIGAAIVDSVNPCTIAVMVLLIGAISRSKGKKKALSCGLLFSVVIFIMYMLYGLGIMKAITSFGLSTLFYAAVTAGALILAIMEFNAYFNYKPGFLAVEMPMFLRPYVKDATQNATSPVGVAVAALLCSIFLIPCSSGPYLMVLGMLAKAATLQTVLYLVLYNMFFVLPMVAITLAVYLGKTTIEKVGDVKEKYIKQIHLASGVILLVLFLMMLNQLLETL